jgi:predicted nucleic acid-binding protein
VIYVDTSALVKLVMKEAESDALRGWQASRTDADLVTSEISRIEISRTLQRNGLTHDRVPYFVGRALRDLYILKMQDRILRRAAEFSIAALGTLDAIHLATAESLREQIEGIVTYDRELSEAAQGLGIAAKAPR